MVSARTWQEIADSSITTGARRSLLGPRGQSSVVKRLETLWTDTVGADKGKGYCKGVSVVRYGVDEEHSTTTRGTVSRAGPRTWITIQAI